MNATYAAPAIQAVVNVIALGGLEPGRDFSLRPNDWTGFDLTMDGDRVVRLMWLGGRLQLEVRAGGWADEPTGIEATFSGVPASLVAPLVRSLLLTPAG